VWTLDSAQDCGTETNKRFEKQPNKAAASIMTLNYQDQSAPRIELRSGVTQMKLLLLSALLL
jgi:hypothetical protein